jgi:O-antigen ligase
MEITSQEFSRPQTWQGQIFGWIGLVMLAFFTCFPESYYQMVAWPWMAVWQGGFLLISFWGIWMLRQFNFPFRPLGYGLDWGVGAIALSLILAVIFAEFRQVAFWNGSIALMYGLLLYVLRNWVGCGRFNGRSIAIGITIIGVLACAIGFYVWWPEFIIGDPRNHLPLGHPNFLAGYILLILPLTFFNALAQQGWQKLPGIGACLFFGYILYTTSSRGGFVGLLTLLLVGTIFFILQGKGKQKSVRLGISLAGIAIILGILLANPRVQQIVKLPGSSNSPQTVEIKADGETQDRLSMWQASTNLFKAKPLFGVGPGNMSRVYNLYRPIEVGTGAFHVQQLHSTPIQILGELGIVGFISSCFFLSIGVYLWLKIYRQTSDRENRFLLYGIGGSLLAYFASGLTDYQLENIPISLHIVLLIVLLIDLADKNSSSESPSIAPHLRRWLSLLVIAFYTSVILVWAPTSWAAQLASSAINNFNNGKLEKAYEQATIAGDLVPWDPTYHLLAGFQGLEAQKFLQDKKLSAKLTESILVNFKKGRDAAPNDAFFNQNAGLLFLEKYPEQAEKYLAHSTRILPRVDKQYTYYLLGQAYLKQNKIESAISAFALQELINTELTTSPSWSAPPLNTIKQKVLETTETYLKSLLTNISQEDPYYNLVYEKLILFNWWNERPNQAINGNRIRPITMALLFLEKNPNLALKIIDDNLQKLQSSGEKQPFLLLGSWAKPEKYLQSFLQSADISFEEKKIIKTISLQKLDLKTWLSSIEHKFSFAYINALVLTYRNYYSRHVAYIMFPTDLRANFMTQLVNLFPAYPQNFPTLDRLIEKVKTEKMNLPHPTLERG